MLSIVTHPTIRSITLYIAGLMFFLRTITYGAPAINVEKTISEETFTVTMFGEDLPELKKLTANCSFQLPVTAIKDAIVAAPLPETALSVIVDETDSTITISVLATSTIIVEDDQELIWFRIPVQAGTSTGAFTVTSVTIIDKDDASIEATINQTKTVWTPPAHRYISTAHNQPVLSRIQLNGRRIPHGNAITVPGVYIRHNSTITPSRRIIFR
jgi:hypothetical protein